MIIVIEGMDGSGKSTLVNQLSKDLDLPVFLSGGPKTEQAMREMLRKLETMADSSKTHICDRVPFVSELVYSRAFDRAPVVPRNELLDYWFLPLKMVYCKIDQVQALTNMSREFKAHKPADHTAMVEKRHQTIANIYDDLMADAEDCNVNIFEYDWQDPTHYTQLKEWIKHG